ncbi:hypothetical protein AMTRI_Chr05g62500 [Amborella trichopoda]|uniref:probable polygalacturonase At1g80170 n=1 Tax=Amborella trichopoda TaxID=13333 RepID=UPI0009BDA222|nr:probable polygalacturonase At1g80170 [Amborella trichopoda]|eukprot:XP_020521978.1 probable polygalacturonase At1g80170 [Amborella trichopoda]
MGVSEILLSFSLLLFLLSLFLSPYSTLCLGYGPLISLSKFRLLRQLLSPQIFLSLDDFGAKGDAITDDTQAFEEAWEGACLFSPSVLEIAAGKVYMVRPIELGGPCRSKVTLLVLGTIVAPKDPDAWEGLNPRKWLYFHGLEDFIIEGGGTIDGMGGEWWARSCKTNMSNPCHPAPTAITFHRCNNLIVRMLKIVNSQQMHVAFTNCVHVKVDNLQVVAPTESPNTDGIHISASQQVLVRNSMIGTGDDCISIVSHSSQVLIKNITCGPGHGISIGSLGKNNSWGQVNKVLVDGAFLKNTENGLRIKTWQGGSGFAEGIAFHNVVMENVSNPIIIDQYYCDSLEPCPNQTSSVKVKAITFINIRGTSATGEAMRFACSETFPCEDIYLENIELLSALGGTSEAFCWEALGSSFGPVYPPPCFWNCGKLIGHLPSNNVSSM